MLFPVLFDIIKLNPMQMKINARNRHYNIPAVFVIAIMS